MRTRNIIAAAALMLGTASAQAQFANQQKGTGIGSDGWNTVWVEYNPSAFITSVKGADNQSFTGLSAGYSRTFGISSSHPLFVEAGVGLQYSFNSISLKEEYEDYLDEDDFDPKLKTTLFSAKVPVNLMYAWQIPNTNISLLPFVGVQLRYNLSGKQKFEYNFSGDEDDYGYYYYDDDDFADEEYDVFDKDDMDDGAWKRFQIGWQAGVKARINDKFLVGLSYGTDFSEIAKKTKIGAGAITLGYTFQRPHRLSHMAAPPHAAIHQRSAPTIVQTVGALAMLAGCPPKLWA